MSPSWAPNSSVLPAVDVWAGCWDCSRQQLGKHWVYWCFLGTGNGCQQKLSLEDWQSFLPTSQGLLSTALDAQLQRWFSVVLFALLNCGGAVSPGGVTRGMPQLWWWHYAGDRLRIPGLGLLFPCLAELPCLLHWQSNTDQPGSAARLCLTFHWDMQLPRMSLENMKLRLNQEWGQVLSYGWFPYKCFSQAEQPRQVK